MGQLMRNDLKLFVNNTDFLRPGTITASQLRLNKVICKVHDSFQDVKGKSCCQWECEKSFISRSVQGPFVSKLTRLKLLFVDKKKSLNGKNKEKELSKECKISKQTSSVSNLRKNETKETETSTYGIEKDFPVLGDEVNYEKSKMYSKNPKISNFALKKQKITGVVSLLNSSSEAVLEVKNIPKAKRFTKTALPAERLLQKKSNEEFKSPAGFMFPNPSKNILKKSESEAKFQKKSFSDLKSLPLYRIAIENNLNLRLKNCRGKLK